MGKSSFNVQTGSMFAKRHKCRSSANPCKLLAIAVPPCSDITSLWNASAKMTVPGGDLTAFQHAGSRSRHVWTRLLLQPALGIFLSAQQLHGFLFVHSIPGWILLLGGNSQYKKLKPPVIPQDQKGSIENIAWNMHIGCCFATEVCNSGLLKVKWTYWGIYLLTFDLLILFAFSLGSNLPRCCYVIETVLCSCADAA